MDLGEYILVGLAIVGFTVIMIFLIAKHPMEPDNRLINSFSAPPKPVMWTTVTRYGPSCGSVKVVDDKYIKYCDLEANHVGDHAYKYITLDEETHREDLS